MEAFIMRKKDVVTVFIVFFCVLLLVGLFLTQSDTSQTEATQAFKLEFEPNGIYDMNEIDAEYCFVYKFDSPNDGLVVYKLYSRYFIVADADSQIAYGNIINSDPDIQFMGLSNEYLLFLTEDGLTAFEFPFEEGHNAVRAWADLSDKEQKAFICPVSYEKYESK